MKMCQPPSDIIDVCTGTVYTAIHMHATIMMLPASQSLGLAACRGDSILEHLQLGGNAVQC